MSTYKQTLIEELNELADVINTKAGTTGAKTLSVLKTTAESIPTQKPEQTTSVALDMASGDQTVTPDSGKVLTQVIIQKPATLLEQNIKKDITIGGVTGTFTADANATSADILLNKTAYINGVKVTGNVQSQGAQTIIPTTADQTIAAGKYLSGVQTIKGDNNLISDNIKSGSSIFGVSGDTNVVNTSGATATSDTILDGYTAYVEGELVTGTYSPGGGEVQGNGLYYYNGEYFTYLGDPVGESGPYVLTVLEKDEYDASTIVDAPLQSGMEEGQFQLVYNDGSWGKQIIDLPEESSSTNFEVDGILYEITRVTT